MSRDGERLPTDDADDTWHVSRDGRTSADHPRTLRRGHHGGERAI